MVVTTTLYIFKIGHTINAALLHCYYSHIAPVDEELSATLGICSTCTYIILLWGKYSFPFYALIQTLFIDSCNFSCCNFLLSHNRSLYCGICCNNEIKFLLIVFSKNLFIHSLLSIINRLTAILPLIVLSNKHTTKHRKLQPNVVFQCLIICWYTSKA